MGITPFFKGGSNFPRGSNFDIFPGKCTYQKLLLCAKLLFSCKLSKTDPQPLLALFQRGRPLLQEVKPPTPINFYHGELHVLFMRPVGWAARHSSLEPLMVNFCNCSNQGAQIVSAENKK